jgi:hypothetical protein
LAIPIFHHREVLPLARDFPGNRLTVNIHREMVKRPAMGRISRLQQGTFSRQMGFEGSFDDHVSKSRGRPIGGGHLLKYALTLGYGLSPELFPDCTAVGDKDQ